MKFEPDGNDNRVKRVELTRKGEAAAVLVEELALILEGEKTAKKSTPQRKKKKVLKKPDGEFAAKIEMIQAKIKLISKEELDGKQSISPEEYVRIGRRLGPYRRELRKIMERGGMEDEDKAEELDGMIDEIFKKREKLRENE